jgi:hypothetical protein
VWASIFSLRRFQIAYCLFLSVKLVPELDVQQQNLLLFSFYYQGGRKLTLWMMLPILSEEDMFGALTFVTKFSPFSKITTGG